ncbi:hypothetical protein C0993_002432, partial [Termitomyces sp. T159_Od127]
MVLDVSSVYGDDDDTEVNDAEELSIDLDAKAARKVPSLQKFHISHLLQMVLQDAQTRLFFKAQSVIQSDIRYYVPRSEDLAYPEILLDAEKSAAGTEVLEKASVSELFRLPSIEKQNTWYPTLRKTVWVLSQLHDFVKPAIFEDIAQEATSLCRLSLVAAADMIRVKAP